MKLISLIFNVIKCVYLSSADPNLFGSVKRRKGKASIAGEFKSMAGDTQAEIEAIKSKDPFQSAAAKGAMTRTARGAKQMQTRMLNVMGAGATPEALVASQGAVGEALGGAAGQIAVGAEAQKAQELARLRSEKMGQMGTYAGIKTSAEEERGSGWRDLFQGIDALGGLATGIGTGIGAYKSATA
jgi:hypothetical protein